MGTGLKIEIEKTSKHSIWLHFLVSFFLALGGIEVLFAGIQSFHAYWQYYGAILLVIHVLMAWFVYKKIRYRGYLFAGVFALYSIMFQEKIRDGFATIFNGLLQIATRRFGKIYLDFLVESEENMVFAGVWIVCLFSGIVFLLLYLENRLLLLFLSAVIGITSCFYETGVYSGLFLYFFGVFLFLLYRKNGILLEKEWRKWIAAVLLPFVLLGICLGINSRMPEEMGEHATSIEKAIHEQLYHKEKQGMPEGELSSLQGFVRTEREELELTMEHPEKLYLRGFIGDVYTGNSWESFSPDTYEEGESLFYWLHKSDFYGQTMIADVGTLMGGDEQSQLTIRQKAACKSRTLIPYALSEKQILDKQAIGDEEIQGQKEVTLYYQPGSLPRWIENDVRMRSQQDKETVQAYLQKEESYREFVYANDLQITSEVEALFQKMDFAPNTPLSFDGYLALIQQSLEEVLTYDETVVTKNGRNDFLTYTFQQSKRGYSVHYATAAVLMLRYCKIPARYVEGYYLPANEAKELKSGEHFALKQKHCHAWAEYYLDGIGWIPFEVTPGYIDRKEEEEIANILKGLETGEEGDQKEEQISIQVTDNPVTDREMQQEESPVGFQKGILFPLLFILVCSWLIWQLIRILKRRNRQLKFWEEIEKQSPNEAIVELYSYGKALAKKRNAQPRNIPDDVEQLFQEAYYSNHLLKEEHKQRVIQYVEELIWELEESHSLYENIKDHYIFWLYPKRGEKRERGGKK